jgi:hypothetical protein
MSANEVFRAVGIHLVTPALGVAVYVWFCLRMRRTVSEPPYFTYFFLFATIGSWLLVVLTALFWSWSGMASLGVFFLLFGSPFIALAFAFFMYPERSDSAFHRWAVRACLSYALAVFLLDAIWIVWGVTQNT